MTIQHRIAARRVANGFIALSSLFVLGACDEASSTSLRISAYGEEYVEEEIPAADLIDGWTITFDRFLIAISEVNADGVDLDGAFVVDLTQASMGEGHPLGEVTVPAVDQPQLAFTVAPPQSSVTPIAADSGAVDQMVADGRSIVVDGQATRDDTTIQFSWEFSTTTRYAECEGIADLAAEDAPHSQLTLHADHLFYDDLDSGEPNVAFDLVASADADGDGTVTTAELQALDITTQSRYQVGSREITDLWGFIEAQTRTLGHIDGEGHCEQAG